MSKFFDQFNGNLNVPRDDDHEKKESKKWKKEGAKWKKQKKHNKKGGKKWKKLRKEVDNLANQVATNSQRIEDVTDFLKVVCQRPQQTRELLAYQDVPRLTVGESNDK